MREEKFTNASQTVLIWCLRDFCQNKKYVFVSRIHFDFITNFDLIYFFILYRQFLFLFIFYPGGMMTHLMLNLDNCDS
jgi:hypothetical protein